MHTDNSAGSLQSVFICPHRWLKSLRSRAASRYTLRMDTLLKLLRDDASLKHSQLAAMLNLPEPEVAAKIKSLEADGTITWTGFPEGLT